MTIFSTYLSLFSAPLVDANSTNPSPTSTSASSPGGAADPYTPSPSAPSHSRKAGRASVDVSEPVELHAMSRPTRPGMMARATSSFRAIPQYFSRGQSQVPPPPAPTVRAPPPVAQEGSAEGYPHVHSVASEQGEPLPVNGQGQGR